MGEKFLKIGTFNLYNLVLPGKIYYEDRYYTQADYERKIDWIAGQLRCLDADVVGFQELFHPEALQAALDCSGIYDKARLITTSTDGEKPAVALVSRLPVLEYRIYKEFPLALDIEGTEIPLNRFSRPVLSLRLQVDDQHECSVYVVHLKSKRAVIPEGADPDDPIEQVKGEARSLMRRAAEAAALRAILLKELQGRKYPVIVVGDVNDSGTAVTTSMISGSPPLKKLPFLQKRKVWDVLLYRVQDIQGRRSQRDVYYTHIHKGHFASLDQIMVSEEFVAQNPKRIGRVQYVRVFNDHLIDETLSSEALPIWQSDHGQVMASIELESG